MNYAVTYSFMSKENHFTRCTEFFRQENGDKLSVSSLMMHLAKGASVEPKYVVIDNIIEVTDADYDHYWNCMRSKLPFSFDAQRDGLENKIKEELVRILKANGNDIDVENFGIRNFKIPVDATQTFTYVDVCTLKQIQYKPYTNFITFLVESKDESGNKYVFLCSYEDICWPVDVIGGLLGCLSEAIKNK